MSGWHTVKVLFQSASKDTAFPVRLAHSQSSLPERLQRHCISCQVGTQSKFSSRAPPKTLYFVSSWHTVKVLLQSASKDTSVSAISCLVDRNLKGSCRSDLAPQRHCVYLLFAISFQSFFFTLAMTSVHFRTCSDRSQPQTQPRRQGSPTYRKVFSTGHLVQTALHCLYCIFLFHDSPD